MLANIAPSCKIAALLEGGTAKVKSWLKASQYFDLFAYRRERKKSDQKKKGKKKESKNVRSLFWGTGLQLLALPYKIATSGKPFMLEASANGSAASNC